MKFLSNLIWWQLFLPALFFALLLILREVYRFPLLNSKFGKITAYGSCVLTIVEVILIGSIFFAISLLAGIFSLFCLVLFVGAIYQIFQKFFIDKCKEIESYCDNIFVKNMLEEFEVDPDNLNDILNRLLRLGNKKAIGNIKDLNKLKVVLKIITQSPKDWTEEDKFVQISNFLEYGKK